ncbi:glycosyltransferase family 4 protein [Antarcticibacterium sp. 1MA-6-2]|uniref:glycosyltransferase family 4 protein n=1 Tax=Antarcticibacterium sp. 1MA-6-2 TaxID=2908210 RepID=UPI001F447EE1|nr:glycosyltransferase family 4 protein [Antarcticibacterium sp. 1MA-6-2]UJH91315.1 glycosyltransferase family 4 protein [Antarcticibacterium sp. 1MA-6-2]
MKILIFIDSLGAGGAEKSTEVICDYLYKEGIYFEVLILDESNIGPQEKMKEKGYIIKLLPKSNFLSEVQSFRKIIEKGNFNLVHSILFRSNLRARFAKGLNNFNYIESLVNTTYSETRLKDKKVNQIALKFYKMLDKASASKVNHFHSITETVKEHYVEELGLNPKKITVIPRGRKPILIHFKDRPEREGKKVQLINVGRHEFQKGQIYLLQAVKILKEEKLYFHLKIFGREGTVTPDLKAFIQNNALEEYVSLEKYTSTIQQHLLNSDVFAFPSHYEGLGGALIEAQAAGLPIVCNNIPVLHEVVIKDQNAKFFDVNDVNSIVEALKFFILNPDKREEYGKKSLQNFHEKFQEKVNNEKLLQLYTKLVKEAV